jgi:hypothetical protein
MADVPGVHDPIGPAISRNHHMEAGGQRQATKERPEEQSEEKE